MCFDCESMCESMNIKMNTCAVHGCGTPSFWHPFPNPNIEPDRFNKWIAFCQNPKLAKKNNMKIFAQYPVCGQHFTPSDYLHDETLIPNAVPSVKIIQTMTDNNGNNGKSNNENEDDFVQVQVRTESKCEFVQNKWGCDYKKKPCGSPPLPPPRSTRKFCFIPKIFLMLAMMRAPETAHIIRKPSITVTPPQQPTVFISDEDGVEKPEKDPLTWVHKFPILIMSMSLLGLLLLLLLGKNTLWCNPK